MNDYNQGDLETQIKRADGLLTGSIACGLVSFLVGGVFLSTVALILGFVGYSSMRKLSSANSAGIDSYLAIRLLALPRKAKLAVVISAVALGLNVIALAMLMPLVTSYLQSGDLGALENYLGISSGSTVTSGGSGVTSTWG